MKENAVIHASSSNLTACIQRWRGRAAFSSPALYRDGAHGQGIDGVWCSGERAVMHTKGQIIRSHVCVLCTMTHCLLSGLVFHTSAVNWLRLRKSSETPRGVALFFGGDNPTNSVNTTAASEGPDWWCWGIIHSCYRFVWSLNLTSSPEVSNWFCVSVDIRIIVFFLGMIEL